MPGTPHSGPGTPQSGPGTPHSDGEGSGKENQSDDEKWGGGAKSDQSEDEEEKKRHQSDEEREISDEDGAGHRSRKKSGIEESVCVWSEGASSSHSLDQPWSLKRKLLQPSATSALLLY